MARTREQIVKSSVNSDVLVNKDSKIKTIKAQTEEQEYYICQTCGKKYKKRKGNFSPSKSPLFATDGYINTCKTCVDELFRQYTEFYGGNEEHAIERICQLFDYYFNESALVASRKISEDRSRISVYISKIQIKPHLGKTYSDTILEKPQNDSIETIDDVLSYEEMDAVHLKKAVSVWGLGFSPEQYMTLNDMFDDWKSRVVIDGKTRETLVRELCIIKLQMNIALKDNSIELYTKLMKTYQETMKSANLQPLQEDANDKASEKPLGQMIQMFELERPIPKCRPEWEDVDGIVKYITIYFLGHLCKMLKINNRYSKLYEDEMAKYRVEIPELEDADDEDVFSYIVDGSD